MHAVSLHAAGRPGKIQFSNGDQMEGAISLTPGSELKLHIDGKQIRTLTLEKVREIRFAATEEKMERNWRFIEAGQAKKEFTGEPYLTRSLLATVVLAGGEKITGHLYTTVFYLESADKVQKLVVLAKQRGKESEGADALKYPTLMAFSDQPLEVEETIKLRLDLPALGLDDRSAIASVVWGSLMTFDARKTKTPGDYTLGSPLGNNLFLAVKTADKILVGWPVARDDKLFALVQTNLASTEDFYDSRKMLGVYYDKPNADLYSVTMMHRTGQTTYDAAKSQPWRLVVQRWKYDEDSQKLLLAGRGFFFRGILAKGEAPPPVELTPKLWLPKKSGEVWMPGL